MIKRYYYYYYSQDTKRKTWESRICLCTKESAIPPWTLFRKKKSGKNKGKKLF